MHFVRPAARLALVLGLASACSACVHAEVAPDSATVPRDTVVVVGQGEAHGKPDIVRLQLGVEARDSDANRAVTAANAQMSAVVDALKQLGVRPEDLQTSNFNIFSERIEPGQPEPTSMAPAAPPPPAVGPRSEPHSQGQAGANEATVSSAPLPAKPPPRAAFVYRVSNMLHVTLRDLSKVGEVLNRAILAGANQAWGISFDIDDDTKLAEQARAEAMADARSQATALAELGGVRLGRVISIVNEEAGGVTPPMPMAYAKAEAASVPIESGELVVRRQVRVAYSIKGAVRAK